MVQRIMSSSRSSNDPYAWQVVESSGSKAMSRRRAANRMPSALPQDSKQLVTCCAWLCSVPAVTVCVASADNACVVQAVPSRYNMLFEDEETALLNDEDGEDASTAAGRISAEVRWQTWPRQRRCSAVTGTAPVLHL